MNFPPGLRDQSGAMLPQLRDPDGNPVPARGSADGAQYIAERVDHSATEVFAQAVAGATSTIDVLGFASIRMIVHPSSSLTELSVSLTGRIPGSSQRREIPVYRADPSRAGERQSAIDNAGVYFVADVAGFDQVRFTVDTATGGTVTLRAVLLSTPLPRDQPASHLRGPDGSMVPARGSADGVQYIAERVDHRAETVFSGADQGATHTLSTLGYSTIRMLVLSSSSASELSVSLTGRIPGSGERRGIPVYRADPSRAGERQSAIDNAGVYFVADVAGFDQVRFTVDTATGGTVNLNAVLLSTPAFDPFRPPTGEMGVVVEPVYSPRFATYEAQGGSGQSMNVERYQSALLVVTNPGDGPTRMGVQGRTGRPPSGSWEYLPLWEAGGEFAPVYLERPGHYWVDLRGYTSARMVHAGSSSTTAVAWVTFYPTPPPDLWSTSDYGAKGYQRITPEDGIVAGRFFALKALTDCTLSPDIRFVALQWGQSSNDRRAGHLDTDELLAGDILYGNFEQVRITSGIALAYRL